MRTLDQRIVLDVRAVQPRMCCWIIAHCTARNQFASHVDAFAKHAVLLQVFTEHMVTLSLSGYMFFGSALAVSDRVLHVRFLLYAVLAAIVQRDCLADLGGCFFPQSEQQA